MNEHFKLLRVCFCVLLLSALFRPLNTKACDESSASLISQTNNANGTITFVFNVCSEYLGLEGTPDKLRFTFQPTTATVTSFSPASYNTSTNDVYTGATSGNILQYTTNSTIIAHGSSTLCNNFTITVSGNPTSVAIDTHPGYSSPTCIHTFNFCNPPVINSTGTNPSSCVATNGSIALSGLVAGTVYSVSYTDDGTAVPAANYTANASGVITIPNLNSGSYTNISATASGCGGTAPNITLTAPGVPSYTISKTDATDCPGTNGTITFSGLNPNTTYTVNASPSFPSTSYTSNASGLITITSLSTGNYTNIFLALSGCSGPVFSGNIDDACVNCGDQTSPCSSAGTFHFAIDGTATANTTGPFDLYSGQVLQILTNGDYSLPPPAGGVYPSGIAFAIFDCDPSGFDLTNPNTYSTSNPCYLDVDPDSNHDYNTSETNCSGVSTSDPTWPSTVWVVPVTYDRYVTGIGGGVTYDANNDNCINFACPFQINYLDITQTIACGGTFTDSNGSNNYCNNASDTWLICPSTPGDFVTLSFTSFATEATNDQLVIRNGSATGTIMGTFSGNVNPGTITSTASNGCLYASFTSDNVTVGAGWSANVSCAPAPSSCGTTFTDSGGASANYNGGTDLTYTFCPDVPGGVVTVTFTSFNVSDAFDIGCPTNKDYLKILNGNSTSSPPLGGAGGSGRYCSDFNIAGGTAFTSTDASGCLTFVFHSNTDGTQSPGWVANVTCTNPCTPPTVSINGGAGSVCTSGTNTTLTATATGGSGYVYDWSNVAGTNNLAANTFTNPTTATTYTVTVTATGGCTSTASIIVYPSPFANISGISGGNCVGQTATINFTGTPNSTINFVVAGTPQTLVLNASGTGSFTTIPIPSAAGITCTLGNVTAPAPNSCTTTINNNTNIVPLPPFTVTITATQPTCGQNNGSISVTPANATTYTWTGGLSGNNPTNITPNTYTVTVTASTGCTASASVVLNNSTPVTATAAATQASCGLNNGSISVTPAGAASYSYAWSAGGSTTATASNLAPNASYTVTVTGNTGCSTIVTTTLNNSTPVTATAAATQASCGLNNGSISVTPAGAASYSYAWSAGGSTTATASNLAPNASYTVTVTGNTGCSTIVTTTLNNSTPVTATAAATQASCGLNNGSITVTPAGAASYSYAWSAGGSTTATASNLAPNASYTVTVTGNTGCSTIVTATLNNSTPVTATAAATQASCGLNNGSITVTPAGAASYSYAWSAGGSTTATASNLAPNASYTVTVTGNTGCSTIVTATLNNSTPVTATAAATQASCGLNNGSISVTPAGAASYSYAWSAGGSTTATASNLAPNASYTVTVTGNTGCSTIVTTTLNNSTPVTATAAATQASCGLNNGSISVTPAGAASYSYAWSAGGSTTATASNLAPNASYTVTVTGNTGCSTIVTTTLNNSTPVTATATPTQPTCTTNTGSITVSPAGATYLWSGSLSGANPTNVSQGTYTVTVTDSNGCSSVTTTTINAPISFNAAANASQPSCGLTNGGILVTPNGAGYNYTWTGGLSGANPTNLGAGTYNVTVTNTATNCTATAAATLNNNAGITVNMNATQPTCGNNNGAILVTPNGTGYSYTWNNASITAFNPTNLAAGTYSVTVTETAAACSATASVVLNNSTSVTATAAATQASCGLNNGSISVTPAGAASYSYAWSAGGSTTATASNLAPNASYTVTVTGNTGCSTIVTTTLNNSTPVTATATPTQPTCTTNTGSITVSPAGATYLWSGSLSGANPTNVSQGTYTVTVTDSNGCSSVTTTTINAPISFNAAANASQPSCGLTNGGILVTPNGAGYNYTWTGGLSGANPTNLGAGTYNVTVTNTATNCTATAAATLNNNAGITVNMNATQPTCGNNNGAILVTPNGTGYSYTWNNASITAFNPTNLAAGTYSVTVTETAAACSATASVVLNNSTSVTATAAATQASCGLNNGSISVTPAGAASYSYAWSAGGSTTATASNLAPNASYTVTVTGNTGCSTIVTTTLNNSTPVTATATPTQPTCTTNTGSITVSPAGATYLWSGSLSGANPTNVSQGTYTVTVTDSNGCSSVTTTTINAPISFNAAANASQPSCGLTNGGILVTPNGAGYNYTWTGGLSGANPTNLGAGTYNVTVTNTATNCTATAAATLNNNAGITVNMNATQPTCGNNNGAILVTPNGTGYSYTWNNASITAFNPTNLAAGTYSVTVTETAAACSATASVVLNNSTSVTATAAATQASCGLNNGSISVTPAGAASYSYAWSAGGSTTATASNLAPNASYTVTVTGNTGCSTIVTTTLNNSTSVTATAAATQASCGLNNGSISVTPAGAASYSYAWSAGGSTTATASNLAPNASYTVTVTGNTGCSTIVTTTLNNSTPVTATATPTQPTCTTNTGSITVSPAGATYLWSGSLSGANPTNVSQGTYTVTVTDSNGCSSVTTTTINAPISFNAAANASQPSCGLTNGGILVTPNGAGYNYTWTGGLSGANPTNLGAGTYNVTVTNTATNCTATAAATLNNNAGITVNMNATQPTCGNNNGAILVTPNGTGYSYTWNNASITAFNPTNLAAGTYSVTVTETAAACSATASVVLNNSTSVTATAAATQASCGLNNGSISVTPAGAASYSYAWSAGGSTTATASNLAPNASYTVTVTGNTGCSTIVTTTLNNSTPVTATAAATQASCGLNNGSITVTPAGAASYSYAWSAGGSTTATASNLAPNASYTVTVTGNTGCSTIVTTTLNNSTPVTATAAATQASCGLNNGSITVTPAGAASYSYAWSAGGSTTATASNLAPNASYTVTVTGNTGCSTIVTTTLNNSTPVTAIANNNGATCQGGTLNLTASGGNNYAWTGPAGYNSATQNPTINIPFGAPAGNYTYTVTVSDNNGCSATATTSVTINTLPILNVANDCGGGSNTGSITSSATAGAGGSLTYTINGTVDADGNQMALANGSYTVIVTESPSGCSTAQSVSVNCNCPTITINGSPSLCQTASATTYTQTGGNANGTWSINPTTAGTINATTGVFTPNDTYIGSVSIIYTVSGCLGNIDVTINAQTVPTFAPIADLCQNATAPTLPIASTNIPPINGTWIPNTISTATIGTTDYLFTPVTNECAETVTLNVNVNNTVATANNDSPICLGVGDATVNLNAIGGSSYTWAGPGNFSNSSQSPVITIPANTPAGSYTYTVTVTNNNCSSTATTVVVINNISATANVNTGICEGGDINLTASGGVAYHWSGAGITPTTQNQQNPTITGATNSMSGAYTVTVTDVNNCTAVATVNVSVNTCACPNPATVSVTPMSICSGASATLTATLGGGATTATWISTGNGTFNTNTGTSVVYTPSAADIAAGSVSITITTNDPDGTNTQCTAASSTVTVTINTLPNVDLSLTQPTCGDNNGEILVTPNGANYNYVWNNAAINGFNPTNLAAATYTVTVTETIAGCSATASVTLNNSNAVSATATPTQPTCTNDTGSISVLPAGATYTWSGGLIGDNPTNVAAGNYTVTVTDNNGCSSVTSTTINTPISFTASAVASDPSCGLNNGSIAVSPNGAGFSFAWTNGLNGDNPNNLAAGTYTVTVTNTTTNCTATASTTLNSNAGLTVNMAATQPTCGNNNGEILVTPNGANYNYVWNNAAINGFNPTNLAAETYTVTVTETIAGCSATASVTLNNSNAVSATATPTQPTCTNDTGSISVLPAGATYTWSGGLIGDNPTNVAAGNYTVTVTDNNGCSSVTSTTINTPISFTASAVASDPSCGLNNGSIAVSPNGAGFSFAWTNGLNGDNPNNLAAGTYTVTVTNTTTNCTATASTTLNSNAGLTVNMAATQPTCGNNNGEILVTPNGANYNYVWNNAAINGFNPTNLAAETYTVTVTETIAGCSATASVTLNNSNAVSATATPTQPTCTNDTGSISVLPAGATYTWSGGLIGDNPTNVAAGNYTVTVTDNNGCSSVTSTTINTPISFTASAVASDPSCGLNNGSIAVSPNGAGFSFAWTNGLNGDNPNNLAAGTYTVTVTNTTTNCTATASTTLNSNAGLTVNMAATQPTCGNNNGEILVTPNGANYNYVWNNAAINGFNPTNLAAETYTVTVTETIAGCSATASVTLNNSNAVSATATPTQPTCTNDTGSISVLPAGATYTWSGGLIGDNPTNVAAGNYTVTVTDNNGCSSVTSTTINTPISFTASAVASDPSCGLNNGSIAVSPNGAGFSFAWTNGLNGDNPNNLAAGTYTVTVTNTTTNCTATASTTLNSNAGLTVNMAATQPTCGNNNGEILVTPNGANYNYVWNNAAINGFNPTNLAAETYTVTVTETIAGCSATASVTLNNSNAVSATATPTQPTCTNDTGSISVLPAGATYTWSGGLIGDNPTNVAAGNYTVTVTDNNGCSSVTSTTINTPISFTASAVASDPSCGLNNGSIAVSPNGAGFSFAWTNGLNGDNPNNLAAGTYTVTVTNTTTNCTATASTTLNSNAGLTVNMAATQPTCGNNNGEILVTPNGANYNYVWNNAAINGFNPTNLAAETYTVTVTETIAGCSATASVTLNNSNAVSATATPTQPTCTNDTGSISVLPAGATYTWSGGLIGDNPTNVAAGNYTVTVTDNNGCSSVTSTTINTPISFTASAVASDPSCGLNNGSIAVSPNGAGFSFAWTNGLNGDNPNNLAAGTYTVTVTNTTTNCTATASTTLNSNAGLTVNMAATQPTCGNNNGEILVTPNGANYNYVWNNAAINGFNPTNLAAETYTVTVTETIAGCSATASVTLNNSNAVSAPVVSGINNPYCVNEMVAALSVTPNQGGVITWFSDNSLTTVLATSNTFTPPTNSQIGTVSYWVVETANDCQSAPTQIDLVFEVCSTCNIPVPIGVNTAITTCEGTPNTTAFELTNNDVTATVHWYDAANQEVGTGNTFVPTVAGTYTAVAVANNDPTCISPAVTATLTETAVGDATFAYSSATYCQGTSNITPTISGTSGGTFSATGLTINPTTGAFDATEEGTFIITYEVGGNCSTSNTFEVTIVPSIVLTITGDTEINLGESTQLTVMGGTTYTWNTANSLSCTDCANPLATPTQTTSYTVQTAGNECAEPVSITVTVNKPQHVVIIPNAFSPNNDGVNDVFSISGINIATIKLLVHDRWGQKMFEAEGDLNNGWDGTYRGFNCELGVYVYYVIVTYTDGTTEMFKNNITLVR